MEIFPSISSRPPGFGKSCLPPYRTGSASHSKFPRRSRSRASRRTRATARAGQDNAAYLSVETLEQSFLRPLEPYAARIAVLIFEFGTFSKDRYPNPASFFEELDRFLGALPRGHFRCAVEVRNQEYLRPEYFDILRRHQVAHVFNAWTRMPPIGAQIEIPEAFTANFIVARALLRVGRPYEQAVEKFAPYDRIQEENPSTRAALRDLIQHAKTRRIPAYLFVNNRLEGNAPVTIQSLVGESSD